MEEVCARKAEQDWLTAYGDEYGGQWAALQGDVLLSHGPKARAVRDEARQKGVARPLLVRTPDNPRLAGSDARNRV